MGWGGCLCSTTKLIFVFGQQDAGDRQRVSTGCGSLGEISIVEKQRRFCSLPQISSTLHTSTSKATQHQLNTATTRRQPLKTWSWLYNCFLVCMQQKLVHTFFISKRRGALQGRLKAHISICQGCFFTSKYRMLLFCWKYKISLVAALKSSYFTIKDLV